MMIMMMSTAMITMIFLVVLGMVGMLVNINKRKIMIVMVMTMVIMMMEQLVLPDSLQTFITVISNWLCKRY